MVREFDLSALLQTALTAAHEAGLVTLRYFRSVGLPIEIKGDSSPVTIADREAEKTIAQIVKSRFPDHQLLGEEFGERSGEAPVRWIIDPIDGTKSFISGVPLYGTLIGVEVEGEVSVGVVSMPALGEVYYATVGGGAFCNGRSIQVSPTSDLSESVILTTSDRSLRVDKDSAQRYDHLVERTLFQRTWGDCYGHMLVASGRAEAMLDPGMSVWDSAPLKVIVDEAGGVFTDWQGEPTIHGGSAISTNALLSESIRNILGIGTR